MTQQTQQTQAQQKGSEFTLGVLRTGLIKLYFQEVRDLLRDTARLPDDVVAWVNDRGECDIVLEGGKPKRQQNKEPTV